MRICQSCGEPNPTMGKDCRICKDGKYRYGMNRLQQLQLLESQGGSCFLCESTLEMFSGHRGGMIDHDHATGEVRGVLCNRCNTIVGGLENHVNPSKVMKYLKLSIA